MCVVEEEPQVRIVPANAAGCRNYVGLVLLMDQSKIYAVEQVL